MAAKLKMGVFTAVVVAALLRITVAQTTHVVGDALGWTVPSGGAAAYATWASSQTFTVGDTLVFNFTTGTHDMVEVSREALDGCNATNPILISTTGPTSVRLNTTGGHYYFCRFPSHCSLGQRLSINVSAASTPPPAATPAPAPSPVTVPIPTPSPVTVPAPAPSPVTVPAPVPSPETTPAPSPSRTPVTWVVGDGMGWAVPPGGAAAYRIWAANKNFRVGDTLVFNFINGTHNVAEVTPPAFRSCNTTAPISTITTAPARITLTAAGEHYYICTFPRHCSLGQLLAINVTGSGAASPGPATAPTPSSTSTPPSGSAGTPPIPSSQSPSGSTSPPPPSSAPSLTAAAFPVTFLSIALAFLY